MYLAWFDASKKLTTAEKIGNAYLRYLDKFGTEPSEVLINPGTPVVWPGDVPLVDTVRYQDNIATNCFWIGTPEDNT